MDKIEAAVAFRQARNKTKSRVGQEYDAVERLIGDTFEGQQILKKFREMNALTKLHNDGYQGGLSKFTDQFEYLFRTATTRAWSPWSDWLVRYCPADWRCKLVARL